MEMVTDEKCVARVQPAVFFGEIARTRVPRTGIDPTIKHAGFRAIERWPFIKVHLIAKLSVFIDAFAPREALLSPAQNAGIPNLVVAKRNKTGIKDANILFFVLLFRQKSVWRYKNRARFTLRKHSLRGCKKEKIGV